MEDNDTDSPANPTVVCGMDPTPILMENATQREILEKKREKTRGLRAGPNLVYKIRNHEHNDSALSVAKNGVHI